MWPTVWPGVEIAMMPGMNSSPSFTNIMRSRFGTRFCRAPRDHHLHHVVRCRPWTRRSRSRTRSAPCRSWRSGKLRLRPCPVIRPKQWSACAWVSTTPSIERGLDAGGLQVVEQPAAVRAERLRACAGAGVEQHQLRCRCSPPACSGRVRRCSVGRWLRVRSWVIVFLRKPLERVAVRAARASADRRTPPSPRTRPA